MATGVQPRNDDVHFNRADLEVIEDAMKKKQFRDLLVEYCHEIRDPANQAIYQKEMTQMEKERGYDITFINPQGGYVIKTSVAGDRKAFINICSNDKVSKPSCSAQVVDGRRGVNWQLPYSLIPPREDYNRKREKCVIYDVVFHPDTLRMAAKNKQFRELVNNTAVGALRDTYNIHLDSNNFKFVKSPYKGMATPAVIRKEDPNFKNVINDEEKEDLPPEMLEKLYPQKIYSAPQTEDPAHKRKTNTCKKEFTHNSDKGYTIPKYIIKQQKDVDMQDFTFTKDCKQYSAIPTQIVIEINLPLLSSTKDCELEVKEKLLYLKSEKPAKYRLELNLPYPVNDQCGNAKFDKSKHKLIVTLPVIKPLNNTPLHSFKVESGVESEGNFGSQSEEEKECLIQEISSTTNTTSEEVSVATEASETKESAFFEPSLSYLLPSYTHNVLDDTVAFTFHVKNTVPESVRVKKDGNQILIKFISIGSGFVPVHYAATLVFENCVKFEDVIGEAWDNNVILQLKAAGQVPQSCQAGLNEESLKSEQFECLTSNANDDELTLKADNVLPPTVEVTNLGTETNIVVSKNDTDDDSDPQEPVSPTSPTEKEIVWSSSGRQASAAHSILRKPLSRSYSESSTGDIASSMDYISSDCIPEESSLKKTVRFSDNISKQFYRYNSSIEGQKKKNQRKKSKKRSQDRRRSESEPEDDSHSSSLEGKSILKSAVKARRDSGLADTSDADTDALGSPGDAHPASPRDARRDARRPPPASDVPRHNTDLYDPAKLNRGEYLEIKFKNDLLFDLDM